MASEKMNDVADYLASGMPADTLELIVERAVVVIPMTNVPHVSDVTGSPEISATELRQRVFSEPLWIVRDLLPVGLTILGGRPKTGKSWLALNLAIAAASGGLFLGEYQADPVRTCYLALEDNQRRLQSRMNMVLDGEHMEAPERLSFRVEFPRFDDGGFEEMDRLLRSGIRLLIIDTLQKLRGRPRGGKDSYSSDYEEIGRLQQLALAHDASIVVLHHTTKMPYSDPFDAISGTSAIAGAADTLLVLARDPSLNGMALHVRGRDVEEVALAVRQDRTTGIWTSAGDATIARLSDERRHVLSALGSVTLGPRELAEATGIAYDATRQLLSRMAQDGDIERAGRGKYRVPVTSLTPATRAAPVASDLLNLLDAPTQLGESESQPTIQNGSTLIETSSAAGDQLDSLPPPPVG